MSVKLLTEHYLEFKDLKRRLTGRPSLPLSKCHIVENHMSRFLIITKCRGLSTHKAQSYNDNNLVETGRAVCVRACVCVCVCWL